MQALHFFSRASGLLWWKGVILVSLVLAPTFTRAQSDNAPSEAIEEPTSIRYTLGMRMRLDNINQDNFGVKLRPVIGLR